MSNKFDVGLKLSNVPCMIGKEAIFDHEICKSYFVHGMLSLRVKCCYKRETGNVQELVIRSFPYHSLVREFDYVSL